MHRPFDFFPSTCSCRRWTDVCHCPLPSTSFPVALYRVRSRYYFAARRRTGLTVWMRARARGRRHPDTRSPNSNSNRTHPACAAVPPSPPPPAFPTRFRHRTGERRTMHAWAHPSVRARDSRPLDNVRGSVRGESRREEAQHWALPAFPSRWDQHVVPPEGRRRHRPSPGHPPFVRGVRVAQGLQSGQRGRAQIRQGGWWLGESCWLESTNVLASWILRSQI